MKSVELSIGVGFLGFWLMLGMACQAEHDHAAKVRAACIERVSDMSNIEYCAKLEPGNP